MRQIFSVLGVVLASCILLAGCGSSNSSTPEAGANTQTNTTAENSDRTNTSASTNSTDTTTSTGTTGALGSELVGTWLACSEVSQLRLEYVFTGTTYTDSTGIGTCAGFDDGEATLVTTGSYSIVGPTVSDTGLDSLKIDLKQETINGAALSDELSQTLYHIVYTGMENQIFFSPFSLEEENRSLEINFSLPYVKQ